MRPDPLAWWHSEFGEIAPRGHLLRRALSAQWVRFHSLPESKRYAESLDEYAEIEHRHCLVASALFSANEPLYVFRALGEEARLRGKAKHQLAGSQFREAVAVMQPEVLGRTKRIECMSGLWFPTGNPISSKLRFAYSQTGKRWASRLFLRRLRTFSVPTTVGWTSSRTPSHPKSFVPALRTGYRPVRTVYERRLGAKANVRLNRNWPYVTDLEAANHSGQSNFLH